MRCGKRNQRKNRNNDRLTVRETAANYECSRDQIYGRNFEIDAVL